MATDEQHGPSAGGRWVAEIYGCDVLALEDARGVEDAMRHAIERLGAPPSLVEGVFHKFHPQGLSGSVMSPVALVTIHTWPEERAATLDLYFHLADANPEPVLHDLARAFGARDTNSFAFWRGGRPARPAVAHG